jgi:oligoendopeptidase F
MRRGGLYPSDASGLSDITEKTMTLNIKAKKGEFPRTFVPKDADLGDWAQIEPLFLELEREDPKTAEELEAWLLKGSELGACIDEEGSLRYIAMTCKTDDPEVEKAYMHFIQEISPKVQPHADKLNRKYVNHPESKTLAAGKHLVFDRNTRKAVEMYRDENVPLFVELAKLGQQYQKTIGAMTVMFEGKEQTLQQMSVYMEKNDRFLREKAWRAVTERRMRDKETIENLFDEMLKVRAKVAANAGYKNFRDFTFDAMMRFDYTPADCEKFHAAVEELIMPVVKKIQRKRKDTMKLGALRPWDLAADPLGRPPLKPFDKSDKLSAGCGKIFASLSDALGKKFQSMIDLNLLDLDSRKGKAPGGYQSTLQERRMPFIFMNAVGIDRDVWTMLHEAGHAFHVFETRNLDLLDYRSAPLEFAEVASMSMELMGMPYLKEFYSDDDARRSATQHLEEVIGLLPWIATIDAFQHWLYTNPGHTRQQRADFWLALMDRFGGIVDWTGLEDARACNWHRQLHIFLHPLYYIEYGIAQLGALQLWLNAKKDKAAALKSYLNALSLGASEPLPKLFEAAGIRFDFGRETIEPLSNAVLKEI